MGRARDLLTATCGAPRFLDDVQVRLDLTPDRTIREAVTTPASDAVAGLTGLSAGRGFRAAVATALPGEHVAGAPLPFLLDDVSVVSGICGIAWSQHLPLEIPVELEENGEASFQRTSTGRIACSGLRPGGYHEQSWRRSVAFPHWIQPAGDLGGPDPWAWHEVEPPEEACFRRRRRIDVWREEGRLEVDAHFRDSVHSVGAREIALHEYSLRAAVDPASGELISITVDGEVLPFPECPWAAPHAKKLQGRLVSEFRTVVPEALTELEACSHLNDMLRGLADVPTLARELDDRP